MAKKRKAKHAKTERCITEIGYIHYPKPGVRTYRSGTCGNWSILDCGHCPTHCKKAARHHHTILWLVLQERGR